MVVIEQVRANSPPIPATYVSPTITLTTGTDPALGRLHGP